MKRFQTIAIAIFLIIGLTAAFSPTAGALLLSIVTLSAAVIFLIYRTTDEPETVAKIFLLALLMRLAVGVFIEIFDLRDFFGGGSKSYDYWGHQLTLVWAGKGGTLSPFELHRIASLSGSGWGMNYFVAAIYFVFGRNIFIAQTICGVLGAATAPAVYVLSRKLYENRRVARTAAILAARRPRRGCRRGAARTPVLPQASCA